MHGPTILLKDATWRSRMIHFNNVPFTEIKLFSPGSRIWGFSFLVDSFGVLSGQTGWTYVGWDVGLWMASTLERHPLLHPVLGLSWIYIVTWCDMVGHIGCIVAISGLINYCFTLIIYMHYIILLYSIHVFLPATGLVSSSEATGHSFFSRSLASRAARSQAGRCHQLVEAATIDHKMPWPYSSKKVACSDVKLCQTVGETSWNLSCSSQTGEPYA